MWTLFTAVKLIIFLLVSIIVFTLFIALEIYCVAAADAHLTLRGIDISWILWTLCGIVIVIEIFTFCVNIIWRSIVTKFRELFSLK